MFSTAVFTDVTSEESVDGAPGFNFQAVSAGMDGARRQIVREKLLHVVSSRWPNDRDPVEHPPTFVYMPVGRELCFSRGVSTGSTVSGRRGNQLTQAALTADAEDLEPLVPAQIFGADGWTLAKESGSDAPEWAVPLEIAPDLQAETLIERALTDPAARQALPGLITLAERATVSSPLVIVSRDLAAFAKLVATATLLLGRDAALSLSIRGFTNDPWRAGACFVGMHPDLGDVSAAGAQAIRADGPELRLPDVEPSALAVRTLDWLDTHDLYEALELVERARAWATALGPALAAEAAELVVTGVGERGDDRRAWRTALETGSGLAAGGRTDDLIAFEDELVDVIAVHRPQTSEELELATCAANAAVAAGADGVARGILMPTLETVAARPDLLGPWAARFAPDPAWKCPQDPDGALAALFLECIAASPGDAFPALMTMASQLREQLDESQVEQATARAASFLLQHPSALATASGWLGAERVAAHVRAAIERGLDADDERLREQLMNGEWDHLERVVHRPGPAGAAADPLFDAVRIGRRPLADRARAIRKATELRARDRALVMEGAQLPRDSAVWAAWLERVGSGTGFDDEIVEQVEGALAAPGASRELKAWRPLVRAMQACGLRPDLGDALEAEIKKGEVPLHRRFGFGRGAGAGDRADESGSAPDGTRRR